MEGMASGAAPSDSTGNSDGTLNAERDSGGCENITSPVNRSKYEDLQAQYQRLRHKHADILRRYEHTMKELEYYRSQQIMSQPDSQAAVQDSSSSTSSLRGKYNELMNDKQRLDREVQALQKEITELRCQTPEVVVVDPQASSDAMNQHYLTALRKYDAIKDEYDSLRKRYDDLIASHTAAVSKLELVQDELARKNKQLEDVIVDRNSAIRERNGLKQQCTAAIRQWDIALRERNEYREALAKVSQQHEEAVKEINQAMVGRMKASKEIKRLTEERNAALHEYSLIMSERDTVHQEMETLSNDLSQAYAKATHLESENKHLVEEKKTLSYQVETLRREISSALHDRDEALKECNELRQKFGDYSETSSRERINRLELRSYSIEHDVANKECAEKESNPRDYAKREKERVDNLDQANQEIDRLRKYADKLQAEYEDAVQEAEVSKRRRDWAFSERDKVVSERESIRTLCDRLRKERDRAVSDLANALRDSDDMKKQRNEVSKELKDLKEKIESGDHTLRASQYSHDSDNEWDAVTVHLDLNRMGIESDCDLGLMLVGGRDNPYYPNDSRIYVAQIAPGSAIESKLRVNDCILRVNNVDCSSTRMILETLRSCNSGPVVLTIRRRRINRSLRTTQLPVGTVPHGIILEIGIYIAKISPESSAANNGYLAVGDRVLNINSKSMEGVTSAHEAMAILDDTSTDVLTITTLKGIALTTASSAETMPMVGSFTPENRKMVNSCSQTEQERMMLKTTTSADDYDRRYIASSFGDRSGYKVSKSMSADKPSGISHAWDNFREKIDIVRGRRHSKDRDEKKKRHRNSSPNTFEQEQDAIAKLDSVIESYHKKASNGNNGVLKRSKRRGVGANGGGTGSGISGTSGVSSGSGTEKSAAEKNGEYSELGSGTSSDSEEQGEKEGSRSGSSTPCNSPEASRKSTIEPLETSEPERDQTSLPTIPTIRTPIERERDRERDRELRASASLEVRSTQDREMRGEIRNSTSLDINIRKPELRTSVTLDGIRNSLTGTGTLTRGQLSQGGNTTLQRQNATVRSPTQDDQNRNAKTPPPNDPRYLFIETRKCSNLGISLVGGNGVGIFVHSVQPGCLAEEAGLHTGDRILEYNGVDLRQATAEQAALELARPADKVTLIAQYMPDRYNEVKDKPGDSFYVKAMFDRTSEVGDSLQLKFNKDDILYVDNTMFNGTPGHWRAWLVDQTGRRQTCGIIPSKFKVEEELLLRRSLGDLESDSTRRGTTSARRSFFRRKKHHRSSSRDSKELSQLTGVGSMGWYSDSGTLNEENFPLSYQRVERLDYPALRPILMIGPLNECVATKLLQDFPGQFTRCLPEVMHCSQSTLEQGLRDSLYVDYRKKGNYFECTTVQAVKEICEKNSHCILDISMASLERLHRHQIYPIVILIKFKSIKQIKEVKDSRYPSDKVSAKAAKEMHEQSLKLETEYRQFIHVTIPAGVNIAHICNQVKTSVDEEQSKALWLPRGLP
ncbi:disks large homolog 5-like isoform X3 [Phymastichus coffea]|uniref:disks large homolog 5-like isoform X3 n=1 Tax=Phymastichus coffea TaxID=108790 RepID=UPI00273B7720|nr:disks large homolog 5-like isoform X3 [Phymastichus coffea]